MTCPRFDISFGINTRPCQGEVENGDRGVVLYRGSWILAMVVDGLGHGPRAARAADLAVELVESTADVDPVALMGKINMVLRGTVGAVAAILGLDCHTGAISYCSVGNIATRILGGIESRMVGIDGVLGSCRRRLRSEVAHLSPGGTILMTSDGISLAGDNERFKSLSAEDLARYLVKEQGRAHDDATALVMRMAR